VNRDRGRRGGAKTGLWWLLAGAWYLLIATLSQMPGADSASSRRWLDLLALGDLNGLVRMAAHMTMFGVQCVLVFRALGGGPVRWRDRRTLAALAITLGLAIADEVHQATVPLRHGRAIDVAFDMVGATLGLLGLLLLGAVRRPPHT
jgi:VanZ family protein